MIGVIIHGPRPFDTGLAEGVLAILETRYRVQAVLAGTMGRTALHDSGLTGVDCPGHGPARAVQELARRCQAIVLVTHGTSRRSGLRFGEQVSARSRPKVPLLQVEGQGKLLIQWTPAASPELVSALGSLGLKEETPQPSGPSCWVEDDLVCREIKGFQVGDFVLVNGIIVGRVVGKRVVLRARGRELVQLDGVEVKEHGLEKLRRFGGVDLARIKLATTGALRATRLEPRVVAASGQGVALVDHAGMQLYELSREVEGVVTVGDDTTAVAGDILYRFSLPLIGIVDGDGDQIHRNGRMPPGSSVLLVEADDVIGLEVKEKVFDGRIRSGRSFARVKELVLELVGRRCLNRTDYP